MSFVKKLEELIEVFKKHDSEPPIGISYIEGYIHLHVIEIEQLGDFKDLNFELEYTNDYPVRAYKKIGNIVLYCLLPLEEVERLEDMGVEIK